MPARRRHATLPRLASALACLGLAPAALAAPSVDQALRPIATARATYQAICARVTPACDAEAVSLYEDPSGQTGWRYYLLADSSPRVWISQDRDFDQARHWSYQGITASERDSKRDSERDSERDDSPHEHAIGATPWRLYPALYRMDAQAGWGWAWAVASEWREMYSGGGAHYEVADFVPFDWPAQHKGAAAPQRVLYAAVPLACSKLVRACFSPDEYERGHKVGHCHDESQGSLRIHQARPATANDPGWQFVWHESQKPAFEPQTHETRQVLPIAPLNEDEQTKAATQMAERHRATRRAALMCGGSQA